MPSDSRCAFLTCHLCIWIHTELKHLGNPGRNGCHLQGASQPERLTALLICSAVQGLCLVQQCCRGIHVEVQLHWPSQTDCDHTLCHTTAVVRADNGLALPTVRQFEQHAACARDDYKACLDMLRQAAGATTAPQPGDINAHLICMSPCGLQPDIL